MSRPRTIIDTIWDAHVITEQNGETLLYNDRHLLHVASFHAFDGPTQKGRTYHRLCLVGNKATEPMMLKFRPLMSTRRQGQIDKAIAARVIGDPANMGRKNREKTACPNGHEYDVVKWEGRKGGGVGIHRRCSTCDKAAAEARKAARNARLRERYQTDTEYRGRKIAESRAARKVTA